MSFIMAHGIIIPLNLLCNSQTIRLSALNKRRHDIKLTIITLFCERLVCLAKLGDDMHVVEYNRANVLWAKMLRENGEIHIISAFHKVVSAIDR